MVRVRKAAEAGRHSSHCYNLRHGLSAQNLSPKGVEQLMLERRAVDIVQPDTCAAGGLSECKKIADMAAAYGIRFAPHVWGTGIALAAGLQLLAGT